MAIMKQLFKTLFSVPPNMPQIIGHSNGTVVEVPFSQPLLQLTCVATNARPAAVLKWFRNKEEVTEGVAYTVEAIENDKRENSRSILSLSPRYPEDNNAIYTCQAQNDALTAGPLQVMVKLSVLCKYKMSRVTRKPFFGGSDQVRLKLGCTFTDAGWRLEISDWDSTI